MGNYLSTNNYSKVFSNFMNVTEKYPKYFIYKYSDGIFAITYDLTGISNNSINLYINEITPINTVNTVNNSEDNTLEIFYDIDTGISYRNIVDNIDKSVSFFSIREYSESVYLGYLYSTKTRAGKFNESLISSIAKDLEATGIYLMDASHSGECENLSLSLQLFLSDKKKFTTYYEYLGYTSTSPSHRNNMEFVKYRFKKFEEMPMRNLLTFITDYRKKVEKDPQKIAKFINTITCFNSISYILTTEKKLDLSVIEYLKMLIDKKKCLAFLTLIDNIESFYIENEIFIFIRDLISICYGEYYKKIE